MPNPSTLDPNHFGLLYRVNANPAAGEESTLQPDAQQRARLIMCSFSLSAAALGEPRTITLQLQRGGVVFHNITSDHAHGANTTRVYNFLAGADHVDSITNASTTQMGLGTEMWVDTNMFIQISIGGIQAADQLGSIRHVWQTFANEQLNP